MHKDSREAIRRLEEQDRAESSVRVIERAPNTMRAVGMIVGGSAVIVIEVEGATLANDGGRAKVDLATKMAAEIFGMKKMTKREEFDDTGKPH